MSLIIGRLSLETGKLRDRLAGLFSVGPKAESCRRVEFGVPVIAGGLGDALSGGRVLLLDGDALERHLAALGGRVGAMPAHVGSRFSQGVARRLAARLAARYAARLGMPAGALAEAWYFSIWSELCTLMPLRHLARRLARIAAGRTVVVPLEPGPRDYLTVWYPNGLEPFYLAAELRRRGVPIAFASSAPPRGGTITVRLSPHAAWRVPEVPDREGRAGTAAVVAAGLRGFDKVLARLADPVRVASAFSALGDCDFAVADPTVGLPAIDVTLRCAPASILNRPKAPARPRGAARSDLGVWLFELLGPPTAAAAAQAARQVLARGVTEAHVCDHLFWESAVVANAVREAGGQVVLWPHSSNAVHVAARALGSLGRINCATRSAARVWRARFPEVPIAVVSDTIVTPCAEPRPLTPSQPVTVVVIAGSHSLNRLPVIDYDGHCESYRQLFHGLAAAAPEIRYVCKAKPPWESIEWLRSLAGADVVLDEIDEAPGRIDLPNLIYVSVSFGSTALLEGLGRGIPCMIVRDIPVEDYTAIGPDTFPVGPVDMILDRLRACRDFSVFRAMAEAQLAWYSDETHFERSQENIPL